MKTRYCWICSLGLGLVALPFAGRLAQEASGEPTNPPPAITPETQSNAVAEAIADQSADMPEPTVEVDLADAAVQPLSAEKPLPPGVQPTAPVAEVIRLAESGVDEGVMLAFVTNSVSAFNLTADEIIYLNDIGVPASVVTAMIQRDQALQGISTNVPPAMIAEPPVAAPTNQYAPAPEVAAPAPIEPPATRAPEEVPVEPPVEAPPPTEYVQADYAVPVAAGPVYSTFYTALTPYGSWVDVSGYGPCWQPTVVVSNPNWQPYFDGGRWVYSDCGWYWLSDYSWGWAPFHYGRWFRHNRIGWCWAPGRVWGPSWVCWRYTTTHCGWAPLPPGAHYRHGTGLMFRGKPAGSTCAFGLGPRSFAVVPFNRFWDRQLPRHALSHTQTSQVLSRSVASSAFVAGNNRIMNNGLSPSRVVAATRTGIHRVAIHELNATAAVGTRAERLEANGSRLSIARPNLPQRAATQPASVEQARTGSRHGSGSVVAGPTAPRWAPSPSLRPPGGAAALQSAPAERPATREGRRPAESITAAKPATVSPAQTAAGRSHAAAPTSAAPVVSRGQARSSEAAGDNRGSAATEALPRGALVFSGRQDRTPATTHGQTPEARPQSLPSQPTATRYPSASRTQVSPRPRTSANVASEAQRPSSAARSAPSPAPMNRQIAAHESQSTKASRPAAVPTYTPSRTFTGSRDVGQRTTSAQPPAATARTFASPPSIAQYQASPRPETSQRPQIQTRMASEVQRPSYTAQPTPAPARVERQYTRPAPRAVEAPRPAPAPSYTPQRSYSPPAAAPAPRAAAPSYSAPASRPSYSAPASSQNRSSGRRGR